MYYVEDQDPILVKQQVELDESELKRLYQEILARFGKYVHRSYDGAFGPYAFQKGLEELKYVKNYRETPIGGEDENTAVADGVNPSAEWMHYEYDEFVVPELAELIKRLLAGDAKAIDAIKKGPAACGEKDVDAERKARRELQDFLSNAPEELDAERFRRLAERVLHFHQEDVAEEKREELGAFYGRALACIHFRSVMTLYKDKWNELRRAYRDVRAFYEGTNEFEERFQKMMKDPV